MAPKPKQPDHVVRLSEAAAIQLALSALEGYVVPHRVGGGRRAGVEISGHLWGQRSVLSDGVGGCRVVDFVDMATVETSADRTTVSVSGREEAITLKCDLMTTFWPHLEFLGDFHTHPFRRPGVSGIEDQRLFCFSPEDVAACDYMVQRFSSAGFRLSLVVTIARTNRRLQMRDPEEGVLRISLGRYVLWFKAYVSPSVGDGIVEAPGGRPVVVDCPALSGITFPYSAFGRHRPGAGHRPGPIGRKNRKVPTT